MNYVYILKSQKDKQRHYVGITNDLNRRISEHNDNNYRGYTKRYAPWKLRTYICFEELEKAKMFETYLKSHSGKAFLKKRFI